MEAPAKHLEKTQQDILKQNKNLENQVDVHAEQSIKTEILSMTNTMASKIAHDLRNPLQIIQVNSELLKLEFEKQMSDKAQLRFNSLQNSIIKMNQIIDDILNFAKTSS
jgi:signal transduction histidine kinase